jgi:hypothetical protein
LPLYQEFYDRDRDGQGVGSEGERGVLHLISSLKLSSPPSLASTSGGGGSASSSSSSTTTTSSILLPPTPPCIRSHLLLLLEALQPNSIASSSLRNLAPFPIPNDNNLCIRTRQLCAVYEAMCAPLYTHHLVCSSVSKGSVAGAGEDEQDIYMLCMKSCVQAMVKCGLSSFKMSTMPTGLVMPLYQALRICRISPPPNWSASCYKRCGRSDLAAMIGQIDNSYDWVAVENEDAEENSLLEEDAHEDDDLRSMRTHAHLQRNVLHSMLQSRSHDHHHRASSMDCDVMSSYPSLIEIQGVTEDPDLNAKKQPKAWAESDEDQDGLVNLESSTTVNTLTHVHIQD